MDKTTHDQICTLLQTQHPEHLLFTTVSGSHAYNIASVLSDYDMLPAAIICDLDGTLALMNGRDPYDASLCENDLLNEPVASIVKRYPHFTLLVSGRKEEHRPQTERWLQKHGIIYDALWMRATDDNRKDVLVKQDIYNQHIKGKYNIDYILDDRNQVVDFWRSEGLTVLQVAEGDF